jgi:hypothetical protein
MLDPFGPANVGTYTPVLGGVANIAASTAYALRYFRIGNIVFVSGRVDIDPTSTVTTTTVSLSLPIKSALAAASDLSGSGSTATSISSAVYGDVATAKAFLTFLSPSPAPNEGHFFNFSYVVV